MEQSGFFDAHLVDGEYDRVYLAEHFAKYFASFIGNGIFGGKSNELQVREQTTTSMSVRVLSGQAWIDGYWYENDSELSLPIDAADGVLNRIDSIVVRWNNSERVIRLAVKKGTSASSPVAPVVQRDSDFYELKLADISVSAGTTRITQANITDKRYNTDVCGLVIGVVQQLDAEEFGIQLDTFIQEFMTEKNAWFTQFKSDSDSSLDDLLAAGNTKIDNAIAAGNTKFDDNIADGNAKVDKLVSDKQTEIDEMIAANETRFNNKSAEFTTLVSNARTDVEALIAELNTMLDESDVVTINEKIADIIARIVVLESDYRTLESGEVEWVHPHNEPGVEYRTAEKWNGKPVYQETFYIGALPNKTFMTIDVDTYFNQVISIAGFAVDSDNNMNYPFPIILNGLTPVAVIQSVEGDGGDGSIIIIQTNDDLSHLVGYITVKYTKE